MQKLVNKIINESVKDADIYQSNGSTWIIFTDNKQWVIELTEEKTLWYNYNFFKNLFNYLSLDVVENQHYITKWVEDNIIGGGVKEISNNVMIFQSLKVEDTIQNGVKETFDFMEQNINEYEIDDTIQNGVKETITSENRSRLTAENIIEWGVKENSLTFVKKQMDCENTIENGVKETELHKGVRPNAVGEAIQSGVIMSNPRQFIKKNILDNTIQSGVKYTSPSIPKYEPPVNEIIENGIKETKTPGNGDIRSTIEWMEENKSYSYTKMIDDVIENGVKETKASNYLNPKTGLMFVKWDVEIGNVIENGIKEVQPLPSQEGNKDWGIYYHKKGNRIKPHTEYVDEALKTGVKYE